MLEVTLSNIPDDVNPSNNSMELAFAVDDQTDFIPLREQFEAIDLASTNWRAFAVGKRHKENAYGSPY